jgi:pilus assembly protein FimV
LPRLLLTGALLSPATLFALGLGEIRLNSSLNQPFDADIELIAPTREELADLKVGLASNELFQRYELDRPAYLSSFSFTVSRSRDGKVSVKVRSNRSITEPFVTFLVEANSSRSRLLREYTVLLDPPMFLPSQPQAQAPVTAPQTGVQNEGRIVRANPPPEREPARPVPPPEAVRPEPAREAPPSEEEPVSRPAATPAAIGGTYNVQRNDTLSGIATRVQSGTGRSTINQTMIALFRANPRAFAGENINRLLAGSVLRVPELADIDAVPAGEASREVARQTEEWSGVPRVAGDSESSRLRLVTPAETPTAPTPAPTPAVETAPERTASRPSNATGPADKRLQVTSPELSSAQQSASQTPSATPPEPAEAPVAEAAPEAEPAPAPPPKRPRPKPAAEEPPAPSFFERIGDFWLVPVLAGLALLVALLFVFLKRRREASDLDALDDAYPPMTFEPRGERLAVGGAAQAFQPAAPKSRDRDAFLVEGEDDDKFDEPAPVAARRPESPKPRLVEPRPEAVEAPAATKRVSADDTLSSETAVRFDQQDALAEADFHMAYGLYDQAADLVKIAISREPARRDLKLKLLEIYFVWGNRDLFLETARDLHQSRDQSAAGEWDKVLIMGKQIAPEDSIFKGGAGATHMDLVDVNLEGGENRVDVDLFAEPGDQAGGLDLEFGSGERRAPRDDSDADLDLLLDEQGLEDEDNEPTREMDPLARTQETPTIESPMIERASQTIRERVERNAFNKNAADQTAELSLDDLGLDVDSLEQTGSLEQTAALERGMANDPRARALAKTRFDDGTVHTLGPDEMTQLAPSLGSYDRTLEAPRVEDDTESTGTIYIDQVDLSGNDTVEQQRPDIDATAAMRRSSSLDFDLDGDSGEESADTVQSTRRSAGLLDSFSEDVFAERTSELRRIEMPKPDDLDLDVGEALASEDHEPTNKQTVTNEMELSELEPVTMSEVGTKLDLARAYMDMGDPDGARSILEEVLAEGTANQKQEAQRLLDSIR